MLSGKDRGKTGKVLTALPSEDRVTIEGLNLVRKRVRAKKQGQKGESVLVPRSVLVGRVALICPSCGKASRVGFYVEGGKKVRVCKRCNATV